MLLEFKIKNYKSFAEEAVFSMVPAPKQHAFGYSLLKEKTGKATVKGLPCSVVYGPNASGKTNIIGAVDTLKKIIARGHIKNVQEREEPNIASSRLELIPYRYSSECRPVEFSITFTSQGHIFEYALSIDIGCFLQIDNQRSVAFEQLKVDGEPAFTRERQSTRTAPYAASISIGSGGALKGFMAVGVFDNMENLQKLAQANLNAKELFLTNGYKNIFSSLLVNIITHWVDEKLAVVYQVPSAEYRPSLDKGAKGTLYINNSLNDAAKLFGLGADTLCYTKGEDGETTLTSAFGEKTGKTIPAESYESYGTLRFAQAVYPMITTVLLNGGTLVADEFDASIHPAAIMSIINAFHNDEINKNGAQLIFNTHNPVFLNSNLLRRDEIKFVESEEEGGSVLYRLSDFKTSGKNGVRRTENYMKNYFVSKYGAIRNIDFTDILKKAMSDYENAPEEAGMTQDEKY